MKDVGSRLWAIPGGKVPLESTGKEPRWTSRDEICVLNAGGEDAAIEATFYFEDREPIGPYRWKVPARRVRQVRVNDLIDPQALPLGVPYAVMVQSDVPVIVQFTRVDTGQATNALATTLACPLDGG